MVGTAGDRGRLRRRGGGRSVAAAPLWIGAQRAGAALWSDRMSSGPSYSPVSRKRRRAINGTAVEVMGDAANSPPVSLPESTKEGGRVGAAAEGSASGEDSALYTEGSNGMVRDGLPLSSLGVPFYSSGSLSASQSSAAEARFRQRQPSHTLWDQHANDGLAHSSPGFDSGWACAECNVTNQTWMDTCAKCSRARQRQAPEISWDQHVDDGLTQASHTFDSGWVCPKCNLSNQTWMDTCAKCFIARDLHDSSGVPAYTTARNEGPRPPMHDPPSDAIQAQSNPSDDSGGLVTYPEWRSPASELGFGSEARANPKTSIVRARPKVDAKNVKESDAEDVEDYVDACYTGDADEARDLLEKGVPVDAQDMLGHTGLVNASACGHSAIVTLLIQQNADVQRAEQDGAGETPLIAASRCGRVEVVRILLDAGVDPSAKSMGKTALQCAEKKGETAVVDLLRKHLAGAAAPNELEEEYEVETILGAKNGKFLVKWKGYSESEATWESAKRCAGCPQLIKSFRQFEELKKHRAIAPNAAVAQPELGDFGSAMQTGMLSDQHELDEAQAGESLQVQSGPAGMLVTSSGVPFYPPPHLRKTQPPDISWNQHVDGGLAQCSPAFDSGWVCAKCNVTNQTWMNTCAECFVARDFSGSGRSEGPRPPMHDPPPDAIQVQANPSDVSGGLVTYAALATQTIAVKASPQQ